MKKKLPTPAKAPTRKARSLAEVLDPPTGTRKILPGKRKTEPPTEKNYVMALLVKIPAVSFRKALATTHAVGIDLSRDGRLLSVSVPTDFDHDLDGQRVIYLHAEEEPEERNS